MSAHQTTPAVPARPSGPASKLELTKRGRPEAATTETALAPNRAFAASDGRHRHARLPQGRVHLMLPEKPLLPGDVAAQAEQVRTNLRALPSRRRLTA